MGDFDGRHNTALPVGTAKNGNKVLNRNNLLGDRPNGEAPIHLSCELIRNNSYVDCTCLATGYFLLSSTKACGSVSPFALLFFSRDFRLERTEQSGS